MIFRRLWHFYISKIWFSGGFDIFIYQKFNFQLINRQWDLFLPTINEFNFQFTSIEATFIAFLINLNFTEHLWYLNPYKVSLRQIYQLDKYQYIFVTFSRWFLLLSCAQTQFQRRVLMATFNCENNLTKKVL